MEVLADVHEQEAAATTAGLPPAALKKWVQVEKGMLSRVLYPNPVCLLSVYDAGLQRKANVMTITWLTPINNQGGFICSVNCNRHTATFLYEPGSIFVLNVPVRGMEELVLAIGGCSGVNVDKFETFSIQTCAPGGNDSALSRTDASANSALSQNPSEDLALLPVSKTKKQKLSKQEIARLAIAEASAKSIAIEGCVAHVLCRVESAHIDDGHWTLRCTQLAAWCLEEYWDGKNFIPKSAVSEPYLTFLGSKAFGYVLPTSM